MKQSQFLNDLRSDIKSLHVKATSEYLHLDEVTLNYKRDASTWSILECFEHLNRYSRYYNNTIANRISKLPVAQRDVEIKSSWLGKKFIQMMQPENTKRQKTVAHMNPANSILTITVINEFIQHQEALLNIIQDAGTKDLNRGRIPVEFFKLLNMSSADALRFVVVHEQRHFLQLKRILINTENPKVVLY